MTAEQSQDYVLGHSRAELDRLSRQGTFYASATEAVFRKAGVGAGMRVLDVGSGAGDVALLTARMVGPTGTVIGIERSPDAVALAQARALAEGRTNCRFIVADADQFSGDGDFDAIVGRLVLMYQPDPAATIRSLIRSLRPEGIVAFQELYLSAATAIPDGPVFTRYLARTLRLFRETKVEIDMGPKLFATFRDAGLPDPRMIGAMHLLSAADPLGYEIFVGIQRSLLPLFERLGMATAAELDLDTLYGRLLDEARSGGRTHIFPPLIGAWSRREASMSAAPR